MPGPERVTFTVGDDDAGRRLDQVLAARVAGLSRRQARVLLDIGGVFVDGRRIKVAGRPAHAGEKIVAVLGGALARATGKPGRAARDDDERRLPAFAVVFEDEELVVVDKPAGLLAAPTPESDRNNLVSLLERRQNDGSRILVVHRIDLETSGLIVFAKTPDANRVLSERFRTHDLERAYIAAVVGAFPGDLTRLDKPVGGRSAVTHVAVRERFGALATLLDCRLETGRTHQIRLHALAAGHPVIGDARYGRPFREAPAPRMALHATTLGFAHPRTGAPLSFTSPWPSDLGAWTERLKQLVD
ncbi:MAG TPA: RluA family pseudouridine synthase [Polyangia bacterium]|jgi:23S rRNA pseudouridine1911/1915/1917 synthase|nr:RluA family pseudouridine synthase [Polyangia bacterium]